MKRRQHRVAVGVPEHVDEVNNHDTAQIAQPQLTPNGLRSFEIGLENSFVEVARTHKTTGVHVDGSQRLCLVDNQIAA